MQGDHAKPIAWVMAGMLLAVFFVDIPAYMGQKVILSALSHHFFHVNLLHLVVNCYAVIILYGRRFNFLQLTSAYFISTLSYFVAPIPPIGFSNMLYATMGLRTPSLDSNWWRSPNTIVFLIVTIGMLFIPNVSALTHIVSFIGGVVVACVARVLNETTRMYGKAKGRY